jgi:hypothetical protein
MRARIGLEDDYTSHSRSRPTAADRSLRELHNRPESFSEPEDISSPQDVRGRKRRSQHPHNHSARTRRRIAANLLHRPLSVTVQEAARILETSADALLEAKYEIIADLRDGGGSIKEQHHCKYRSQEADVK